MYCVCAPPARPTTTVFLSVVGLPPRFTVRQQPTTSRRHRFLFVRLLCTLPHPHVRVTKFAFALTECDSRHSFLFLYPTPPSPSFPPPSSLSPSCDLLGYGDDYEDHHDAHVSQMLVPRTHQEDATLILNNLLKEYDKTLRPDIGGEPRRLHFLPLHRRRSPLASIRCFLVQQQSMVQGHTANSCGCCVFVT